MTAAAVDRFAQDLLETSDVALGVRLLANVPTNEARTALELTRFSERAAVFGADLADRSVAEPGAVPAGPAEIVERTGGLEAGGVLARYGSRGHVVELFTDTVAFCEDLVDDLGWRSLFPVGSVRAAAVEHERAHHLVVADRSRGLRLALDHVVFRLGSIRRYGFVAGADEVAAHAFAGRTLGLERSPLLLTAVATAALPKQHRPSKEH